PPRRVLGCPRSHLMNERVSAASEPRERSAPAKRRARERVGESEGRSPSDEVRSLGMLAAAGIILLLIALTGIYVAAELGAVGVRRSRLRRLCEDGHAIAARLLPIVENPT